MYSSLFPDDGVLQTGRTVHGRVLGKALGQGVHGGLLDVFGGIKIRLTGAQADDIAALGLEFSRHGGDREGG